MAIIEVVPDEVRYWLSTGGCISRGVQEVASAVQGKVTVPGELRTITKEEVSTLGLITYLMRLLIMAHRSNSPRAQGRYRNSNTTKLYRKLYCTATLQEF